MPWRDVEKIRAEAPLVHNITNYVVMNTTANALLALGASPVMAHAAEEVPDMAAAAAALSACSTVTDVLEAKKGLLKRSEMLDFVEASDTLASVGGLDNLKRFLAQRR